MKRVSKFLFVNKVIKQKTKSIRHKQDIKVSVLNANTNFFSHFYSRKKKNTESLRLVNFLSVKFVHQIIRKPTRLNNILDLIMTNEKNFIENILVNAQIGNGEHSIVLFTLKVDLCINYVSKRLPNFRLALTNFNFFNFDLTNFNSSSTIICISK